MKMIGMRVGQQHGIEPRDAGIEQLLAKIGRRIDQQDRAAAFDEQRTASPPVARIGRDRSGPNPARLPALPKKHRSLERLPSCNTRACGGRCAFWNSRKKFSVVDRGKFLERTLLSAPPLSPP